jgi:hypothetical protein
MIHAHAMQDQQWSTRPDPFMMQHCWTLSVGAALRAGALEPEPVPS